jgi:two-component system NtrC family sensor kinase/two-component system sensor histidine kinase AtoS
MKNDINKKNDISGKNDDFISQLDNLIQQTYKIEKEYKSLKQAYVQLESTVKYLIDYAPNALWIFNLDGHIFARNEKANELSLLLNVINLDSEDKEIEFNERNYLIKINKAEDKILLNAIDVTHQRQKERLITMGQMAAHLSHEIRNPIGSISLLASTLAKRAMPKNIPLVNEIKKSVYRIERIIKATLMFSKGTKIIKETFSLLELKKELEVAIRYYSYSKNIIFNLNLKEMDIHADIDLLTMLFSNLIFNAIDAIEEVEDDINGLVEINHTIENNYIIFKIYDNGIKIQNKQKLFQAFSSTKLKGNGLGLILSKQIVDAHKGKIYILEEEQKGFAIKLPIQ